MRKAVTALALFLAGCGVAQSPRAETYTLYRNSPFDLIRIHWATFDADDRANYNMGNCLMAARLLNANMDASAKAEGKRRDTSVGFWCEEGEFRETGQTPTEFPGAFPTDV